MTVTIGGKALKIDFVYVTGDVRGISAALLDDKGGVVVGASSYCHPKDNFCKETGRKLALTRAIAGLSKEERRAVWEVYRNRRTQ